MFFLTGTFSDKRQNFPTR